MEPGTPISIVDETEGALEAFRHALEGTAYTVSMCRTIEVALENHTDDVSGVLIVDLNLWLALAQDLRSRVLARNKLIISGQENLFSRVIAGNVEADDYIVKPISPFELMVRIDCVLRRTTGCAAGCRAARDGMERVRFSEWIFDAGTFEVVADDGRRARLTSAEAGLLNALIRSPNRILTRDQLLQSNPLGDESSFERSVDVLISRLRRKLEADIRNPTIIKTVYGAGYQFDCDPKWLGGKKRKQL